MVERVGHFGVRVSKEYLNFGAAHFLLFPDGSREELHGHNYHVAVTLQGDLADGDVVVDFLVLKPLVKEICDSLDHRTLMPTLSPFLRIEERANEVEIRYRKERFLFPRGDVRLLPLPNLSAEHLAAYIGARLEAALMVHCPGAHLTALEVEVEETPGQSAFFRRTLPASPVGNAD